MIDFILDVTAVVVGLSVYRMIRRMIHERRYYSNHRDYPNDNW
jgi:hypothetical protein